MTDALDEAIAAWLERKETESELLPGEFARSLSEELRERFLAELESLAELDRLATGAAPRDLPLRYGDFRVLGEVGRGAMGVVYCAERISTGARVALKVLHAHVAGDAQSASRFRREARTAQSLDHEGVVPVLDFGDEDGAAWLAMELVEGRSLQRLLVAAGDPRDVDHESARDLFDDPRRLASVLADVADAIEHAHRSGVVHRDIKPANLMVRDGGGVAVLDFGLATARDANNPTLTRTGDLLGTPLYMAPEQAVGAENGTPASDVYALGAVLFECLCGRPPTAPGPLAVVIDSILNRDPPDPRRLRPGVPADLARVALQCLEKQPARRYASAAELARDLRRFAAGESVHARPSGPLQRTLRRVRRRPLVTVLAACALVLTGAVVVTAVNLRQQAAQARALERADDLRRVPELLGGAPERITVFGGASLRFYGSVGLGVKLPAGPGPRSPRAAAALEIAGRLASEYPDDAEVQRALAMALLDVGDDPARTRAVLGTLLALPDSTPGDRVMQAVFAQQQGDPRGDLDVDSVDDGDAGVAFWLGLWHQHRQDYFAAIAAFDRALENPELDEERRYFALLHRGWCRTCPEVLRLRAAEDDLLQAAALRPAYGTAKLLWAALRCLDPEDDLSRPVAAVGEVLENADTWVTELTARVLLALAEAGTWQAGPVMFGAEFSPIAVRPITAARAAALSGLALQLLDGVLASEPEPADPGLVGARLLRVAALTLNGRHGDAVTACEDLLAEVVPAQRPLVLLQRARVHLAAGRTQRARADIESALALDGSFVAGWRLLAAACAHVGDLRGELGAVERAVDLLAAMRHLSVFPDAAALLPELLLRRAELLRALARGDEAERLLAGDLGGVLAGGRGARARWQRLALRPAAAGAAAAVPERGGALPGDSPLRWLLPGSAAPDRRAEGIAAALQRGWVPATALPEISVSDSATANLRLGRGEAGLADAALGELAESAGPTPIGVLGHARAGAELAADAAALPLGALLPHLGRIASEPGGVQRVLALADAQLRADPDNGEARLLRGAVLFFAGQSADAAGYLGETLARHPDDLRARYLLAAAALSSADRELLRLALRQDGDLLDAATLEGARAALRAPVGTSGQQLIDALE